MRYFYWSKTLSQLCCDIDLGNCYNTSTIGKDYYGSVAKTKSGKTCQRWDANTPHIPHEMNVIDKNFPENSVKDAENYCRNPDAEVTGPWCYTTDVWTRWETCNIPICAKTEGIFF